MSTSGIASNTNNVQQLAPGSADDAAKLAKVEKDQENSFSEFKHAALKHFNATVALKQFQKPGVPLSMLQDEAREEVNDYLGELLFK